MGALLVLIAAALAAKPPLVLDVTDPAGKPLPSTLVRFHAEGRVHLVPSSGRLQVQDITPAGAAPHTLGRGDALTFDVWAPGHAPTTMRLTLRKPKNNRARVLLTPARFDATGDTWGEAAVEALGRWETAQLAWWGDRTEARATVAARYRTQAAAKSKLWYDSLGRDAGSDAARYCRITSADPKVCGPQPLVPASPPAPPK